MTPDTSTIGGPTRLPLARAREIALWCRAFVLRNRGRLAGALLLFALAEAASLVAPQLLGRLVESVQEGTTTGRIDLLAIAFAVALTVQSLLLRSAMVGAALLGERVLASTRETFVRSVLGLPLRTVESAGTGDLLSRATQDVERLDASIRLAVPEIVTAALSILLTVVAMLLTSPLLTLGLLVGVPFAVISTRWYRPRATRAYDRLLVDEADVLASTNETAVGATSVESFGLAGRRRAHHGATVGRVVWTRRRTTWLQMFWYPSLDLATMVPMAATLLIGGLAYRDGLVGLGALTAMMLYVQGLAEPLNELLTWTDELQIGNAALRRILGVDRLEPERSGNAAEPAGRHIALRGVCFGYEPDREILHDVDLDVAPGERIAVVGTSGAGKSTLAKLIAGVHPPTSGTVEIGGVAVPDLDVRTLRRQVVLVTQEHHVFAGTVRDNLALPERPGGDPAGDGEWSDRELWAALGAVGLEEWALELPDGLDTPVGDGETAVPVAAAQQLALARLVLADPHTLVLDEATALLDVTASRRVERSMAAVLRGRSVISIVHRLDSMRDADRIAVLEDGRVVELGSHDELLVADGAYADLWRSWTVPAEGARP